MLLRLPLKRLVLDGNSAFDKDSGKAIQFTHVTLSGWKRVLEPRKVVQMNPMRDKFGENKIEPKLLTEGIKSRFRGKRLLRKGKSKTKRISETNCNHEHSSTGVKMWQDRRRGCWNRNFHRRLRMIRHGTGKVLESFNLGLKAKRSSTNGAARLCESNEGDRNDGIRNLLSKVKHMLLQIGRAHV